MNKCSLSGNMLKIIAALSMLIDHIGYILFPNTAILRIIGRISFPIFAFMIAEGCRYTKNKARYFALIAVSGIVFQCVSYLFSQSMYMNVFITFSLSILLIYSLHNNAGKNIRAILFLITATGVFLLNMFVEIDYGFLGCMLPVFASIYSDNFDKTNQILLYTVGILILSMFTGGIQIYSLLSVPLLFLYNGKKGKLNMKYFFYIFYPLHLAILYGINLL